MIGMCTTVVIGADEAKGNLRYTITVSKFENKANWSGQWQLGDGFGAIMTDRLMRPRSSSYWAKKICDPRRWQNRILALAVVRPRDLKPRKLDR